MRTSPSPFSVDLFHIRFADITLGDTYRLLDVSGLKQETPIPHVPQAGSSYRINMLNVEWSIGNCIQSDHCSVLHRTTKKEVVFQNVGSVAQELKLMRELMEEQHGTLKKTIDEGNEKKAALVSVTNKLSVFSADGLGKGISKIGEALSKGVAAIQALNEPARSTNVSGDTSFLKGLGRSFMEGAQTTAQVGSRGLAKTLGGALVAGVMAGMVIGAGYGLKTGWDAVASHSNAIPSSSEAMAATKVGLTHLLPGTTVKVGSVEISTASPAVSLLEQAHGRAREVVDALQIKTPGLSKDAALRMATAMSEVLVANSIIGGKSAEEAVRDQALLMALKKMQMDATPMASTSPAVAMPTF